MRLPRRGERGFTLIELLIVVAILGVLAAVVIPNVTRFFGKGEAEARRTEFHNVQLAVATMMVDNGISSIPNPKAYDLLDTTGATNQMGLVDGPTTATDGFPDYETLVSAKTQLGTETYTQDGYVLFGHQIGYDSSDPPDGIINAVKPASYLNMQQTVYFYTCETDGTVRQFDRADLTHVDLVEYTN